MGLENRPKMSRPTDAEITGTRPGIDPEQLKAKYRSAGAWALGLGIPAMCFWYIAPLVIIIAIVGIVQGIRTGDQRDTGFAVSGLCLALLGLLLAALNLVSRATQSL